MSSTGRQYAGRSQEDRRDDRRQRLLAAGLALIGREGVGALSVRGVCAEAALVPRYFYEEFGNTDELARQLFDREFDAGIARVGIAVATVESSAASHDQAANGVAAPAGSRNLVRVEAAVGAVLDFVTEVPSRAALLLTEASGAGPLSERRRERMADVVAIVAEFGRTSYGDADAPTTPAAAAETERALGTAAAFVAGGLSNTVDEWVRGRLDQPRDALTRELAAQIVAVGDAAVAGLDARLDPRG